MKEVINDLYPPEAIRPRLSARGYQRCIDEPPAHEFIRGVEVGRGWGENGFIHLSEAMAKPFQRFPVSDGCVLSHHG